MVYKELVEKIIDLLKADANLATPDAIKRYYFGPPVRMDFFPLIYVKWIGGPVEVATPVKETHTIRFHIVVIHRHVDQDKAEKFVMDKAEAIDNVLDDNPTLEGLVDNSWLSNVEAESSIMGDYAVSGVRLTLEARRMMT